MYFSLLGHVHHFFYLGHQFWAVKQRWFFFLSPPSGFGSRYGLQTWFICSLVCRNTCGDMFLSFFRFPLFFIIFGSGKAGKGCGRHLKGFLEGVALSSQSMGPWGATATPFMPIFMISGHQFCVSPLRCQPENKKKLAPYGRINYFMLCKMTPSL